MRAVFLENVNDRRICIMFVQEKEKSTNESDSDKPAKALRNLKRRFWICLQNIGRLYLIGFLYGQTI